MISEQFSTAMMEYVCSNQNADHTGGLSKGSPRLPKGEKRSQIDEVKDQAIQELISFLTRHILYIQVFPPTSSLAMSCADGVLGTCNIFATATTTEECHNL
jgi:hypothetical protein